MPSHTTRLDAIDWPLAMRAAHRLLPEAVPASAAYAEQTVAELHAHAQTATVLVGAHSHLPAAHGPTLVVDRAGLIQAKMAMIQAMAPEVLPEYTPDKSSRIGTLSVAAILAAATPRTMAIFDVYTTHASGTPGRLLLAAPNMVATERKLGLVPADFRLWVCLHEQAHRAQAVAAPWLTGHLLDLLRQGLASGVGREERQRVESRAGAIMSVLEGHANVVMDRVGRVEIATVDDMRARCNRRKGGWVARCRKAAVERAFGMDVKLRQYREGAVFVGHVVDRTGWEGINRAWSSAEAMPTPAELRDPDAWIHRVCA